MAQNMGVHPKFNILGGYDISEKKRSEFNNEFPEIKIYASAEKLIRETELDLLYIGTPPASHAEYVKMSASRKLAIFCEKPLCVDDSQGSELVKIVKSNKIFNAITLYIHQHSRQKGPMNIFLQENKEIPLESISV